MRCVGGTRLPRGRQKRQVPPPKNAVKHTLNGALGTAPPLTISMGSSVLGRPKSEGGEGWPRHGNAAAEESACTQERPPLVSSSRLSASTTKSMGMELMRPYALWTAAASAFMSRYKGAAQGMSKTTCETPDNIAIDMHSHGVKVVLELGFIPVVGHKHNFNLFGRGMALIPSLKSRSEEFAGSAPMSAKIKHNDLLSCK